MTTQKAKATTAAPKKAAPKPDLDKLERIVTLMKDYPSINTDMLHRLDVEEGMTFRMSLGKSLVAAGKLKARGQTDAEAVENWGNAARRLLRAEGRAV
ncbi:hypothetical protein P775_08370 [Puniceibacterium antarcticum]|uniref:Uncharacterized protein n=1 Tax=Puniceibacterium antarcticum TaxID=1206336 RepID=A0A2G8RG28_9RHOB|nr:hypothetical protein [Puniceibacterium antarcticum]PIL20534.1 hypothetical protein P775_08370 [Puniceibacterium antarcticum]